MEETKVTNSQEFMLSPLMSGYAKTAERCKVDQCYGYLGTVIHKSEGAISSGGCFPFCICTSCCVRIGGGVADLETARVCALRGHHVILCEKSEHLGGNLIPGGVPHFKLMITD